MKITFQTQDIKAGKRLRGPDEVTYRIGFLNGPKSYCLIAESDYWVNKIGSKADLVNHLNDNGYTLDN